MRSDGAFRTPLKVRVERRHTSHAHTSPDLRPSALYKSKDRPTGIGGAVLGFLQHSTRDDLHRSICHIVVGTGEAARITFYTRCIKRPKSLSSAPSCIVFLAIFLLLTLIKQLYTFYMNAAVPIAVLLVVNKGHVEFLFIS